MDPLDKIKELREGLGRLKTELRELYFEKIINQNKINQKLRFFGKQKSIDDIELLNAEIVLKLKAIDNQKVLVSQAGGRLSSDEHHIMNEEEHNFLFRAYYKK